MNQNLSNEEQGKPLLPPMPESEVEQRGFIETPADFQLQSGDYRLGNENARRE